MAKIFAPNKQYTGLSASIGFVNGVGETEDKDLLKWFKDHGYDIAENKQEDKKDEDTATGVDDPDVIGKEDEAPVTDDSAVDDKEDKKDTKKKNKK